MPPAAGGSYRLIYSQRQRAQLRAWIAEAVRLGILREYLDALKTIDHSLKSDPLAWGDPNHQLRQLRLVLCHRVCPPLHVFYGVEEALRIVFVKDILFLPKYGIEPTL
jgi:hypothetical protein